MVSNGTDVAITVLFDGSEFTTVSANSSVTIPTANLPPVPFELGARLPSGQAIATRQVTSPGFFLVRVGLTCGVLDIWSASTQPLGPRPDPAQDIPC